MNFIDGVLAMFCGNQQAKIDKPYVVGVGGANIDIAGKSFNAINLADSNPGTLSFSFGGVTRNIIENLARLSVKTVLISAVGTDEFSKQIRENCESLGIKPEFLTVEGNSSYYLSLIEPNGDMTVALSDMRALQQMDKAFLDSKKEIIQNAAAIECNPCLAYETLEYLVSDIAFGKPLFADPVSTAYAKRIKPLVKYIDTIKPNRYELSVLADDMPCETESDIKKAAQKVLEKGCRRVVVTLETKGNYYADQQGNEYFHKIEPIQNPVNVTGAGDSFTAGLIYSYLNDFSIEKTMKFCSAMSALAVMSESPNNKDLNLNYINNIITNEGTRH